MATSITAAQQAKIDQAVAFSLGGIQSGKSFGSIQAGFSQYLYGKGTDAGAQADGLAFTDPQISALTSAFAGSETHGAGFVEQGSSAAPFAQAWESRLHELFPVAAAPVVTPTPAATPTPVRVTAPAITQAIAAPAAAPTPANVAQSVAQQVAQIVAQLQQAIPAAPVPLGPTAAPVLPAPTTTATVTQAPDTSSSSDTSDAAAAAAAAIAAGNANVPGSGSVGGGIGYADTSGNTALTQTPTTTTGPDPTLLLLVLGLVGVAGLFWWLSHRHGHVPA